MTHRTGFHDGRLGIGLSIDNTMGMGDNTGNPRYPLDVNGDIRLTGAIVDASGNPIEMMAQQRSFPEAISTEDIDIGDGTAFFESNVKITGDLDFTGTLKQDGVAFVGGATTLNELSDVLVENNSIWLGSDPSATTNNAQSNVAIGINALDSITDGGSNVSIGYEALTSNTSGSYNVALGRSALKSNTSGFQNVAIGENTLYNCVGAAYNVAIGREVLTYTNSGRYNIGLGYNAVQTNTTGYFNIGIGYEALKGDNPHTGEYNIGIGHSAGKSNKTGDHNISFGSYAGPLSSETSLNNRLYIGSSDASKGSNTFIYGHMDATNPILAFNANVGIGTTSPSTILTIKKPIDSVAYGSGTRMIDFKSYMTGYHEATVKASIYCGVTDKRPSPNTQAGYMAFMTTEGTTSTPTERMRIEYNGNVGIGTTNPANKLEIHGGPLGLKNGNHTATTAQQILFGFAGATNLEYAHSIRTRHNGQSSANDTQNSIDFYLWKKGDTTTTMGEKHGMSITAAGVGIGTTSPDASLHIKGTDPIRVEHNSNSTLILKINYNQILTEGDNNLYLNWSNSKDVIMCGSGNVGIGRTDPTQVLDVKFPDATSGDDPLFIQATRSGLGHAGVGFRAGDANWHAFWEHTHGDPDRMNFGMYRAGSGKQVYMALTHQGRLGIGTTDPQQRLHVFNSSTSWNGKAIIRIGTDGTTHYGEIGYDRGASTPAHNYGEGLCFSGRDFSRKDMVILSSNGNVGIGTTSPGFPLEVAGNTYYSAGNTGHINYNDITSSNATNDHITIKASNSIWAGQYVFASSDERIKKNIVDVPDNLALEMVRNIPVRYYEYKNTLERGFNKTIGFIAQDVKEVLPMAVSLQKNIIPNEMRNLTDISWNDTTLYTDLSDCSGVKYRFYVSNDENETRKEVIGNSDNSFTFDISYNKVFCYGKEVDDFHTLDKNKLFALNFSATQELDRQQQADKDRISDLEAKNTALENTVQTLISRITALENNSTN